MPMASYSLSPRAAEDIDGIYEYTILNFGLEQAREYLFGLLELFVDLADRPLLGRSADTLAPELRRFEYRSHVVFYVPTAAGVLVARVLHAGMDPGEHI